MQHGLTSTGHRWLTANAVVAWLGLGLSLTLNAIDFYPPTAGALPSRYGTANPAGAAGVLSRLADWISYFTTLSNVVAAVVATALASGRARDTAIWRGLRLSALLCVTITAIVYAVMLSGSSTQRGIDNLANSLIHQVTPALTVLVWLVAGPRGWVGWRAIPAAFVVPLGWIAWMLGRGAIVGAYPYPFVDVVQLGYPQVALNVGGILGLALVLAVVFVIIEQLVRRRRRPAAPPPVTR
ncbi:MAG TPA: Pr6Pr family membrane protein [Dermatophilaceae bacterium]|nr:Pr6Pr family membrane protein [Dermatophilaceae bacterium]